MTAPNAIAVIANRGGSDNQALLTAAAAVWSRAGLRVVGLTAGNAGPGKTCSAGFLHDIAAHEQFSIRLDAPAPGSTCSLDPSGMERACQAIRAHVPSADVVVLSKFGKFETMQRGLWPAFEMAVSAGKPLLTTVSVKHVAAWEAFAPKAAWIEADQRAIEEWWRRIADCRSRPPSDADIPDLVSEPQSST
jgi:hypothetical protein